MECGTCLGDGCKQRIRAHTQAKQPATQSEELPAATTTANIPATNIQQSSTCKEILGETTSI